MIKREVFDKRFRQLVYVTKKYYPDSEISFRSGMWFDEEGYKQEVWEKARKALDCESWHRDDIRGIIDHVNTAMGKCGNLLSIDAYAKSAEVFLISADKIAPVFYDLYQSGYDQDQACFEAMAKHISNVYDAFSVAAYFFFLKDPDRYSPVRKDADTKRLNQIGGKASCMLRCTWDNYMVYMDTVRELRDYLREYIPETSLLDAQSFLWMLHHVDENTPEELLAGEMRRFLFCNIAWMEHYDAVLYPEDCPVHGGAYIAENNLGHEEMNFHRHEDGYCYGFVETGSCGKTDDNIDIRKLHIEKIDPSFRNKDRVDGVTVVFCAYSDLVNSSVIVGWYRSASVYRDRFIKDGWEYNLRTSEFQLLPPGQRVFTVPRANKAGVGFGQSNVWYADGDKAKSYVEKVIDYISKPFEDDVADQIGSPLSVDQWIELIRDGVVNEKDIRYLAKFYAAPNHAISCSDLGRLEGKHHSSYIKRATDIGRKVGKVMNLPKMLWKDGVTELCFPVEFLGRYDQDGHYSWCVRPELAKAMEKCCPDLLGAGIVEFEKAEKQETEKVSDDELLVRAKAGSSYIPVQYTTQTTQYRRNEYIAALAKKRADGKCMLCGKTPFLDKYNNAYLEVHHIVWLAKGGADSLENVAALCPNCHRKMHINPDDEDVRILKEKALAFQKEENS